MLLHSDSPADICTGCWSCCRQHITCVRCCSTCGCVKSWQLRSESATVCVQRSHGAVIMCAARLNLLDPVWAICDQMCPQTLIFKRNSNRAPLFLGLLCDTTLEVAAQNSTCFDSRPLGSATREANSIHGLLVCGCH